MNKENKMILKVYDIDYGFIIKNYLDKEMWSKSWTIFEYKKFVFTLNLSSINTEDEKVIFRIKMTDNNKENLYNKRDEQVYYSLKIDNLDILKKQINSTIASMIEKSEQYWYIIQTEEYENIQSFHELQKEKLENIALDFLDSEGVTNDDIRDAYIESYVDKNDTFHYMVGSYICENKYRFLTDLYLMFYKVIGDTKKYEYIIKQIDNNDINEIIERINEEYEYIQTVEFDEDMKDKLESI